jgi:hypothetical protein
MPWLAMEMGDLNFRRNRSKVAMGEVVVSSE